jgi:hypothetical protein
MGWSVLEVDLFDDAYSLPPARDFSVEHRSPRR